MIKSIIIIIALVGALFPLALIITRIFPIIEVVGESMFPTYIHGEHLLSFSLFRRKKLRKGDIVICETPYDMGEVRLIIKRVDNVLHDENGKPIAVYLLGDNPDHSYDSRDYGYVDIKLVYSKVIRPRKLLKRGEE